MSVSMNSVFSGGWKNIKNNPILFVPNILSIVFSAVLYAAFLIGFIAIAAVFGVAGYNYFNYDYLFSTAGLENAGFGIVCLIFLTIFAIIVICSLVSSYVQAGLIGMSQDAAKTGFTKISSLFSYGNKYFLRVFAISILMAIVIFLPIVLICLIFILSIMFLSGLSVILGILLLGVVLIGFIAMFVYIIAVSIYFYFVSYAAVIDNTPVFASFRKSVRLINENKSDVIVFFLLIFAISIVIGIISSILSMISAITLLGSILYYLFYIFTGIFVSTFITVWGTRMYLTLTGNECFCGCLGDEAADCSENENCGKQNTDMDS